jgi:diketogulonate reductase-like aldo/keto reductase
MQFVEANGAKILAIGLGTSELWRRTCARIVEQVLKLGYRISASRISRWR